MCICASGWILALLYSVGLVQWRLASIQLDLLGGWHSNADMLIEIAFRICLKLMQCTLSVLEGVSTHNPELNGANFMTYDSRKSAEILF